MKDVNNVEKRRRSGIKRIIVHKGILPCSSLVLFADDMYQGRECFTYHLRHPIPNNKHPQFVICLRHPFQSVNTHFIHSYTSEISY